MKEFEIKLADLRFYARHGVMEQETKVGNEFIVEVKIRIPYREEILDDNIEATISYADLYEIVAEEMNSPRKLLETVAARIYSRISAKWCEILGGEISICKSTPPIPGVTGVSDVRLIF